MKLARTTPPTDETLDASAVDLVPLSTIAPELAGTPTVDELAKRLAEDVEYDAIGRRCISPELATVLLDAERQRRAEAEAQAEAKRAAHVVEVAARKQAREQHRRQLEDAEIARRVRGVEVDRLVEAGMAPAEAIVALDGEPEYDGATGIPRPSTNPFLFGESTGGRIGPPPKPRLSRAERRAQREQAAQS